MTASKASAAFSAPAALSAVLFLFLAAPAPAKPYEAIKGESSLTYVLVHPMHTVKGITRDFECKVELSDDTVSSRIRVAADVRKFDSGNSSRDSHALEAVDALKFPRVSFESRSIKPEGGGYLVAGDLTFHGVTRPVSFHVTPALGKDRVEITGTFEINLSDYGVERPSLMFMKSKDQLTLRFDLFAKP
ncbi:MAG TPA: YceI family protein [Fibrobacteria bacterium]|nr:YceI family protein [Fibrobacteria bacterium]